MISRGEVMFFIKFLVPKKIIICDDFSCYKKYQNYHLKVGRCYHTIIVRNGYYQNQRHISTIFDLLVNPEIMEKKEGVGFFFDKPNNLRLAGKKKPTPLRGLVRNPCN